MLGKVLLGHTITGGQCTIFMKQCGQNTTFSLKFIFERVPARCWLDVGKSYVVK